MASKRWYVCGVPRDICTGGTIARASARITKDGPNKAHGSPLEAFRCKKRHLLLQGYEAVGQREFRKPGGGIVVLTKKSRFGARLRSGKEGRAMDGANRGMAGGGVYSV